MLVKQAGCLHGSAPCKALAWKPTHRARRSCRGAGGTFGQQAEALAAPLDVLVGTPGKVAQHAAKGNLFYGDVQLVRRLDDVSGLS